jgi:chromosome segregation ATPase
VNKSQAIKLLENEGWTKADAMRALEPINFSTNPDEITIRRAISTFAGSELINRQRLQAAQKGMVTKKNKEIERHHQEYVAKIEQLKQYQKQETEKSEAKIQSLSEQNKNLEFHLNSIKSQNNQLIKANEQLQKDNKALKNLVDAIKLKLAIDTKKLLQYEDSEIRKALITLFKSTLG